MLQLIFGFVWEANFGFLFLAIFHLAKQEDKYLKKEFKAKEAKFE